MTLHSEFTPDSLKLRYTVAAPREKVFRFWTDPAKITQWLGGPEKNVTVVHSDVVVRGTYEYIIHLPDAPTRVRGEYLEVTRPERLVYTWVMGAGGMEAPPTTVRVEFYERNGATEITLTHSPFTDTMRRDNHAAGWIECFERLADMLDFSSE